MNDIDESILNCISSEFKTVKEISEELNLPYVRVAVRLKGMRIRKDVISIQSNEPHIKGVKPLKYRKNQVN